MVLSNRFKEALGYAADLHRDQKRKGSEIPYISHLLSVCGLVLEYGADEPIAIAALLHDAVEDQPRDGKTQEEIAERFGEAVRNIVLECGEAGEHRPDNWHERKKRYIAHLQYASESALLVSACDKLHNAGAILRDYKTRGAELWKAFNAGEQDILWYYRQIVDTLRARSLPDRLMEELESTVTELERLVMKRQARNDQRPHDDRQVLLNVDDTEENADSLRGRCWDLPTDADEFLLVIGGPNGLPAFMKRVAARAMPDALKLDLQARGLLPFRDALDTEDGMNDEHVPQTDTKGEEASASTAGAANTGPEAVLAADEAKFRFLRQRFADIENELRESTDRPDSPEAFAKLDELRDIVKQMHRLNSPAARYGMGLTGAARERFAKQMDSIIDQAFELDKEYPYFSQTVNPEPDEGPTPDDA